MKRDPEPEYLRRERHNAMLWWGLAGFLMLDAFHAWWIGVQHVPDPPPHALAVIRWAQGQR